MRSPDFGNNWKLVKNTRVHRTMGGELRRLQGNAPIWEAFTVSFSAIKNTDYQSFKDFVSQNAGQLISLIDFEGRTWIGIITSPNIVFTKGKTDCDHKFSFSFEGT